MRLTHAALTDYLRQLDTQTAFVAKARAAKGQCFGVGSMLRVPWGFTKRYIFKGGFLGGAEGFVSAALGAMEDLLQDARLLEQDQTRLR